MKRHITVGLADLQSLFLHPRKSSHNLRAGAVFVAEGGDQGFGRVDAIRRWWVDRFV